jgi:S1-C subfamily serine protease
MMRTLWFTVPAVTLLAAAACAEEAIPPQTLAAIKSATVFVKVKVKYNSEDRSGSGSGFVIKTVGDSAYVVTNHHVVDPAIFGLLDRRPHASPAADAPSPDSDPRLIMRHFKASAVTVVFRSGTPKEQSARAEVLAADFQRDLAVLKVSGVRELPAPLDTSREPQLLETMPVYTLGFPFGEIMATGKNSPAITVGKGSISSLRLDDKGELAVVQIDGSMNPGNSGGPVVDAQGRLVGVAVATIRGSSGIGLAVPAGALSRMLPALSGRQTGAGETQAERAAGAVAGLPEAAAENRGAVGHGRISPEEERHGGDPVVPGRLRHRRPTAEP